MKKSGLLLLLAVTSFCIGRLSYRYEAQDAIILMESVSQRLAFSNVKFERLFHDMRLAKIVRAKIIPKKMDVTGYTDSYDCEPWCNDPYSASMKKPKSKRTIACPPEYEFGRKMFIRGIGLRVCEDRGGAIKKNKIDIFFDSKISAKNFGLKKDTDTLVVLDE